MKLKFTRVPNKYKNPFVINGLRGSILISNSNKNQNILYVGNLLTGVDLNWHLLNYLQSFGNLTSVDLPGIGGMNSFRSIDKQINLDNYVDYLISIIKSRYKNKRFVIFADGFGLVIVTKLLLKYSKLSSQVKIVICINGALSSNCYDKVDLSYDIYGIFIHFKKLFNIKSKLSSPDRILKLNPYYKLDFQDPSLDLYKTDRNYLRKLLDKNDYLTHLSLSKQLAELDITGKIKDVNLWNIHLSNSNIDKSKADESIRNIYSKYNKSSPKLSMLDILFDTNNSISNIFTLRLRKKLSK